jgi:opacity protein-like surface antigen
MRRCLLVLTTAFCFSLGLAGTAKAQDTVQIFGGYSYLRPAVTVASFTDCPLGVTPPCPATPGILHTHPNLNGWELSGTYNFRGWLGATADFSGHYGTVQGSSLHYQTYLFGPQVHLPGPVSPFAHVLIGGAHESIATNGGSAVAGSATAFALALGAGIDIKVVPLVSVRPIQIDYLVTRFGSSTQNQPRVSAGLVVHF